MTDATRRIPVITRILEANDRVADENRRRFAEAGVCVVNLVSSPGAGKTTLLEHTLPALRGGVRAGVIVGDIATTRDAERLAVHDVPVVQITTEAFGGSCHLEATTIRQALDALDLDSLDLLFVENVGNLVCPAEFDLGEHAKVALLSVTEGEDKPIKYPLAFQVAELAVITKIDLVPHLRYDLDAMRAFLEKVNPRLPRVEMSIYTGQGLDAWMAWLEEKMARAAKRG
ncbi:MAG: hydrogenase nickel incorporation protein HypB [Deltaproteobacteria bacterium]|nr:hydrogenase nickel incorporation protein HypB [Deltaproteobacteria bacterium]